MKRRIFTDKTVEAITYLKAHLPQDTYWTEDMMKMLLYLADLHAVEKGLNPVTEIRWYRSPQGIEAFGLENLTHWESFALRRGSWQRFQDAILRGFHFGNLLTRKNLKVLENVIDLKTSDAYRVGSFSLRSYIEDTNSIMIKRNNVRVVRLPFRETPVLVEQDNLGAET